MSVLQHIYVPPSLSREPNLERTRRSTQREELLRINGYTLHNQRQLMYA